MPLTATPVDINAYQKKVQKNKITPHDLPPCLLCATESAVFKLHGYRERRFLIIVETIVQAIFIALLRFRCPGCRRTYTYYPDFAVPNKHYTRQTIMEFSRNYVEAEHTTYQKATMLNFDTPGHRDDSSILSGSTIHRWVTTVSGFVKTGRKALELLLQANPVSDICRKLSALTISPRKYRSENRKDRLLSCRKFLVTEFFFQAVFQLSIFTKLARNCRFA